MEKDIRTSISNNIDDIYIRDNDIEISNCINNDTSSVKKIINTGNKINFDNDNDNDFCLIKFGDENINNIIIEDFMDYPLRDNEKDIKCKINQCNKEVQCTSYIQENKVIMVEQLSELLNKLADPVITDNKITNKKLINGEIDSNKNDQFLNINKNIFEKCVNIDSKCDYDNDNDDDELEKEHTYSDETMKELYNNTNYSICPSNDVNGNLNSYNMDSQNFFRCFNNELSINNVVSCDNIQNTNQNEVITSYMFENENFKNIDVHPFEDSFTDDKLPKKKHKNMMSRIGVIAVSAVMLLGGGNWND